MVLGDDGLPQQLQSVDTVVDIQQFTAGVSTWTKPPNARCVYVVCIGPGGAGGSGMRTASGIAGSGGQGGSGGGWSELLIDASLLGSTETVTVGASAAPGAAGTTDSTNGVSPAQGGNTTFGASPRLRAFAGRSGQGGLSTTASVLIGGQGTFLGGNGGATSITTTGGAGAAPLGIAPGGAGSGGAIPVSPLSKPGGSGGGNGGAGAASGGVGGAANGGAGQTAGDNGVTGTAISGAGGAGGASAYTAAAQAGSAGGFPGGGGGGGGASLNGFTSGAGGYGGAGLVIVYSW
jgi:hypothetical protein